MKTIGLIGGMSWESTVPYYAMINEAVQDAPVPLFDTTALHARAAAEMALGMSVAR